MKFLIISSIALFSLLLPNYSMAAEDYDYALKSCKNNSNLNNQLNCECYASQFSETKQKMIIENQSTSHPYTEQYNVAIKNAEKAGDYQKAEKMKEKLAELQSEQTTYTPNADVVSMEVLNSPVCMDKKVIQSYQYKHCKSYSGLSKEKLDSESKVEAYCKCYADHFSNQAIAKGQVLGSKLNIKYGAAAGLACDPASPAPASQSQSQPSSSPAPSTVPANSASESAPAQLPTLPDGEKLLNEGKKLLKGLFN